MNTLQRLQSGEPVRALSWWQPFATFMLYDKVETRKWPTEYRGLVLICSSKVPWEKQPRAKSYIVTPDHLLRQEVAEQEERQEYNTLDLNGMAIAIGTLTDSRPVKASDKTFFHHTLSVGWEELFSHVYTDVRRIKPFQIKGTQGWFYPTEEQRDQIIIID